MIRTTLFCLLIFLVSCSTSKEDGNFISRPFSAVDSSRELVLATNHTFEVVLPSNPTTGYDWVLNIDNPEVVRNISHQFVTDSSGRVGVGGNTTWTLRTVHTGNASLTFSYSRPWETGTQPTRVVTFTLSVR